MSRWYIGLLLLMGISLQASNRVWNILIYMDTGDTLAEAALRNINDLLQAPHNDRVRICLQLHAYDSVAWRYRVSKGILVQEGSVQLTGDYKKDVMSAARWAYKKKAAYNGLIIWGNGYGILEPQWDEQKQDWAVEYDAAMEQGFVMKRGHRAMLINSMHRRYMNNEDMAFVVNSIAKMLRKPLDVLGLDCCLGACLEHAYQCASGIRYLVACQNCELKDGFEYKGFGTRIARLSKPVDLVKGMVADYDVYYQKHAQKGLYTLSAVDCKNVEQLKKLLDTLSLILFSAVQSPEVATAMKLLRMSSPSFCLVPMYTDLYSVLEKLEGWMAKSRYPKEFGFLVQGAKRLVRNMIIANATGENMKDAHGVSIYFPLSHVDSSYSKTAFATDCKWYEFLQAMTA